MGPVAIVWMLLAGIGIAVGSVWYSRRFLGGFVRKLIELDITSPETAVTPEEVHCKLTAPLRNALKEDGSLSGILGKSGDRYYLLPKRVDVARRKYRAENTGLPFLLLTVGLLILTGALFTFLYPFIADAVSGMFA